MNTLLSQDDLMVAAAWMYYQDGLTQQEVAEKLNLSRVTVTRLLQRARQEGLVQVRITRPLPESYALAQELQETFALQKAILVKSGGSFDETLDAIAQAGAEHLREVMCHDCRLGFGWSTTVSRMAAYLTRPEHPAQVQVSELAGSMLGTENPYSISGRVAEVVGGNLVTLPVPVLVNNQAAYQAMMQEPSIKKAMAEAAGVDVAFVGLGDLSPGCTLLKTGHLAAAQMEDLRQRGAVGDMLLRFYDLDGRHVPHPMEEQTISLRFEQIRRIPYVATLAAGASKVDTILGALRGSLIDCLVSDTETARRVLARQEEIESASADRRDD
jgi:DNA-binding transcriptional regulator LsrR (DeoR family)